MPLKSNRLFLASATRDFKRTGAFVPSSKALAGAMIRELVARYRSPVGVLEVGGGTGSITQEIARNLGAGDRLDVYEIDRKLAGLLRQRLTRDKDFPRSGAAIRVFCRGIERIERKARYDFVISCLPFTNFEPAAVREIFDIFRSVLEPGGVCSFYEYVLVRKAARMISGRQSERARVQGVSDVVKEVIARYEYRNEIVFRNLPPAIVHHVRFSRS
jgi:phospholipid N-methyltransferase